MVPPLLCARPLAGALLIWLACSSCGGDAGSGDASVLPDDVSRLDPEVVRLLRDLERQADARPADAEARGRLGLALEANALPVAALDAFREAARLDPTRARWHYHAARLQAQGGSVQAALASIDRAILREPSYAPAHWRRGKWLMDLGRLEEAEASFRECARLEPGERYASLEIARVYLQRDEWERALPLLGQLAAEDPDDAHVHQLLGVAYRQAGDLDRARAEMLLGRDDIERDRPDPWRNEGARYRVGYAAELERGLAMLFEGNYRDGIAILERIRPGHEDDVGLLSNLGTAYCATGQLDKGRATLEAALRIRPGHAPSILSLIEAYEVTGELQPALDLADRGVEMNPAHGGLHLARARLLLKRNRRDEALAEFGEAARLGGETAAAAHVGAAKLEGDAGRWDEAIADYRAALRLDPELAVARIGLVRACAEFGDLAGAREELEAASAHVPSVQLAGVRARVEDLERRAAR